MKSKKLKLKMNLHLGNLISLTTLLTVLGTTFGTIINPSQHQQQQQQNSSKLNSDKPSELIVNNSLKSDKIQNYDKSSENYLLIDFLPDGEMERRISYDGLTAKETSVGKNSSSVRLWQLSNGKTFFQMIYSGDYQLVDCEYVRQKHLVKGFIKQFYAEVNSARARNFTSTYFVPANSKSDITERQFRNYMENGVITPEMEEHERYEDMVNSIPATDPFGMRNLTYIKLNSFEDIPAELSALMNYNKLKGECDIRHRELKEIVTGLKSEHEHVRTDAENQLSRKKRQVTGLVDFIMVPHTKWCGRGQKSDGYTDLGGLDRADKCCRKHDHCRFYIEGLSSKWNFFNYSPFTLSHCFCDKRKKRDLYDVMRMPGTKWCGKGFTADKYTDIGGYSKADRCCRQHDIACPYFIGGFESKWGVFNWRVNTVMHCNCDERKKRGVVKFSDFGIMPHTKWCGTGHVSDSYKDLGGSSLTDKCCRRHDYCRFFIHGYTEKWDFFNYRPFTISHCTCDSRFRTCLKIADCSDANFVGKLFFNIVQTKCFVLKREKFCKKHKWWNGKCEKTVHKKRAHLRNNRPY